MPKSRNLSLTIKLNLLKPQSSSEKIPIKFISWLFSSGRYIFVIVNGLVLVAFITRFKFDADLASKKEAIAEQIPYIKSLKPYELLIRNTQLKLSTIDNIKKGAPDWSNLLKRISDQIPTSVTIISIDIKKDAGKNVIHLSGQTRNNGDINSFVEGLKADNTFSDVNLANVGLDQGIIKFDITASAATGGKSV